MVNKGVGNMKLITFTINEQKSIGVLQDQKVIDLHAAFFHQLTVSGVNRAKEIVEAYIPRDMVGFLEGGEQSFKYAKNTIEFLEQFQGDSPFVYDRKDVRIEAPVQNPKKIICVGHNYREHILEMGRELPTNPVVFAKFANTIIGPEDDIPFYPISEQLDYEAEFTFVIGKRAKNVSEDNALDYVAGYTICNDVTYRDIQSISINMI